VKCPKRARASSRCKNTPVSWAKQAKEEQTCLHSCDVTVSWWHRYSKWSIPDTKQEAKEQVLQNQSQYFPETAGNRTVSQTDQVTYGIRLGPLPSVDLFQQSIEQPPEIQALQRKERGGRRSACKIPAIYLLIIRQLNPHPSTSCYVEEHTCILPAPSKQTGSCVCRLANTAYSKVPSERVGLLMLVAQRDPALLL